MTWPNLFVIGAPRCGTTSLHGLLDAHPDVFMSRNKEPWFYALEGDERPFTGPGDGQGVRDRGAYGALFEGVGDAPAVGESSTLYLASHRAPGSIRADAPDAKIVAVLRNPVERAFSNYNQHRWQGREVLSFAEAIEAGPGRVAGGWAPFWDYRAMGRYGEQLARWYAQFPSRQIKVIIFDDLVANESAVLADVYRFLGVDDTFEPGDFGRTNAAAQPKSERLHSFLRGSSRPKQALRSVVPERLRVRMRAAIDRRNRERPDGLPPEVEASLAAGYEAELTQVERMIGRDLPRWLNGMSTQPGGQVPPDELPQV